MKNLIYSQLSRFGNIRPPKNKYYNVAWQGYYKCAAMAFAKNDLSTAAYNLRCMYILWKSL
jgi:hypothetical protein